MEIKLTPEQKKAYLRHQRRKKGLEYMSIIKQDAINVLPAVSPIVCKGYYDAICSCCPHRKNCIILKPEKDEPIIMLKID